MNLRAVAAKVIYAVIAEGCSLSDALSEKLIEFSDSRDKSLLQAICYGVCRWYFRLKKTADALLSKPLKEKDVDIYLLILVGLYQLSEMRMPDYAVVSETVAATKDFKKIWAKALVNGVLREYLRRKDKLQILDHPEAQYSHPLWMMGKLEKDYPEEWQAILTANNQHPPLSLRVNKQVTSREKYLSDSGIPARMISETSSGIMLENPMDVEKIPGFLAGAVSVQDGAAQLAAELLLVEPGQYVLDACAAPGGKTAHLLELEPTLECVAIDKDEQRLQSVQQNLARLHLSARCITADASEPATWWDGRLFDRILLDAPCSASGIIRRHPDIKLLRRPSDIRRLVETQQKLLNSLWSLLKPEGVLLYVTCSVFPEENTEIVQAFLSEHPAAREEKILGNWGKNCPVGKQILPGMNNMDGFYFARLRK